MNKKITTTKCSIPYIILIYLPLSVFGRTKNKVIMCSNLSTIFVSLADAPSSFVGI